MRNYIRNAKIEHAKGHIAKHKMNVEIFLHNAVGVGNENSADVLEAIEKELNIVAMYDDQINMMDKYFKE